jgi:2-iminobutanoate/2-iminopropanoate deaminase
MMKNEVKTQGAPAAIGPYVQAVRQGNLLFCSGQIALDPGTGQLLDGNVAQQTERVLENLKAVIEAGGSDLSRVLKTTVYLVDMGAFSEMNAIYGRYFAQSPPARSTVAVAALPRGAQVEIDAIAEVS